MLSRIFASLACEDKESPKASFYNAELEFTSNETLVYIMDAIKQRVERVENDADRRKSRISFNYHNRKVKCYVPSYVATWIPAMLRNTYFEGDVWFSCAELGYSKLYFSD